MVGPAMCSGKQFVMQTLSAFCLLILLLPGCSSPPLEVCGGSFADSGTIATPYFPFTYPPNMRCVWNLEAKNGNVIVIQFLAIDIDVTGDLLVIYNGSTSVMNITGSRSPFNLTLGPRVTLNFISDESVGNSGIQLRWSTGISCQPGYEYLDGHTCMPCTGAGNYLSRKVRNCSLDKDAEYGEAYLPPVQQDTTDKTKSIELSSSTVLPSSTVLQTPDHTETTVLWEWLGPVIVGFVLAIAVTLFTLYRCMTRRMESNGQSPFRRLLQSQFPAETAK